MRTRFHIRWFGRFRREEEGVALVEFALFLPLFLLAFFTIVEFSRLFFSYQGALTGVRDATRYMARTLSSETCEGLAGGTKVNLTREETPGPGNIYYNIVLRNMDTELAQVLPVNVELLYVQPAYFCVEGAAPDSYRQLRVPMAEIEARFRVTLPLVGILELNGQPIIDPIEHSVVDQSRIYGL